MCADGSQQKRLHHPASLESVDERMSGVWIHGFGGREDADVNVGGVVDPIFEGLS